MVVTFFPATLEIGVIQERVISPLMCTVQAPQSAMPHPNLVPVMFKVSRRTQSRGISGLTSTVWDFPLRIKVVAIGPPRGRGISYNTSSRGRKGAEVVQPGQSRRPSSSADIRHPVQTPRLGEGEQSRIRRGLRCGGLPGPL